MELMLKIADNDAFLQRHDKLPQYSIPGASSDRIAWLPRVFCVTMRCFLLQRRTERALAEMEVEIYDAIKQAAGNSVIQYDQMFYCSYLLKNSSRKEEK